MAKRTVVITLDVDTDNYDEFEGMDVNANMVITLVRDMLNGEADLPEEGVTIACAGVSEPFKD